MDDDCSGILYQLINFNLKNIRRIFHIMKLLGSTPCFPCGLFSVRCDGSSHAFCFFAVYFRKVDDVYTRYGEGVSSGADSSPAVEFYRIPKNPRFAAQTILCHIAHFSVDTWKTTFALHARECHLYHGLKLIPCCL